MAKVPFNTTIDEDLLLEMKKVTLDYKTHLNDLIEACWRCFTENNECEVKKMFEKRLKK
jgi:hypothetical protein